VTQRRAPLRPTHEVQNYDEKLFLPKGIETSFCRIIYKEVQLHSELSSIKSTLIQTHYFTIKNAFRAIDDWNAKWIDHSNLKRFLTNMGYHITKSKNKK
tara:strand:+ start:89 stop:385 length:297 start_codon:yes stop_codon:yes gene_type:complete